MHQHIGSAVSRLGKQIDTALEKLVLQKTLNGADLILSIQHSLLAPGKRARGTLLMLAAGHGRAMVPTALAPACAVEMVHAASLIFDDLPAMDGATLRRGRQANHRAFGEATAILSGIALLNEAFAVISAEDRLDGDCRTDLSAMLSHAIGLEGLVAGQFHDLRAKPPMSVEEIKSVHEQKTGALFAAAAQMGGRVAGRGDADLERLRAFGMTIGLAFQTFDDLIDAVGSSATAQKTVGADGEKPTLVRALGAEGAEMAASEQMDQAIKQVSALGPDGQLLANFAGDLADLMRAKLIRIDGGTGSVNRS